jgi:hypothetical protein
MKNLRILGMILLVIGVLAVASWFIEPLRNAWPAVWLWFLAVPAAIRFWLILAVIGLIVVFVSLLIERAEDHRLEGDLTDEP